MSITKVRRAVIPFHTGGLAVLRALGMRGVPSAFLALITDIR